MTSEVLYRKWRPRSFSELAGQEIVARTMTNAVSSGKVSHAYLFSGPRGTGKTTTGRLLAKAVNCAAPKEGEPCNECESCVAFIEGRALDLVELDAASNRGIDEIRGLREKAQYAPAGGEHARKVYLVDEVHMLTEPAFNALLKILEEPPPHVVFVLATTDAHKVPATVVSRCQRFDFRRIPLSAVVQRLEYIAGEEGFTCATEGLETIARCATGSLRDAINLLEQLVDSFGRELTQEHVREGLGLVVDERSAELAGQALHGQLAEGLGVLAGVRDDGLDLRQFQRHVVAYLRGLLQVKAGAASTDAWSEEQLAEMASVVGDVSPERIVAALRAFGEADLRADPLSPLPLEIALATCTLAGTTAEAPQAPPAAAPAKERMPTSQVKALPTAARREDTQTPPQAAANGPKDEQPANAPEPEARAPVLSPSDRPNHNGLEQVRSLWPEIYQRSREIEHTTGALLNSGCGIIQVSENEVVFGFRHQIHLDKMLGGGGNNVRALQQAIDEKIGSGRVVRCVLAPDVDVQRPAGKGGHLVRAAQEMGARVLDDEQ